MSHSWRKIVRGFMSFQRSDRNAVIIIGALVLIVVVINTIVLHVQPKSSSDFSEINAIFENWEKTKSEKVVHEPIILFDFDPNTISEELLDSLSIPKFVKQNLLNYRKAGGAFKSSSDVRKIYGLNDSIYALIEMHIKIKTSPKVKKRTKPLQNLKPLGYFDPNTVDSSKLEQYGFNNYQANNLINYRSKGGVFSNPTDLLKIYGIDSVFYSRINQYIKIEQVQPEQNNTGKELVRLELNTADTTDLIYLKGIGTTYANRIINYRNLLGGFYNKEQLSEVYNFPEEVYQQIETKIYVDTLLITKLRINFSDFSELLKHPYLSKKQVKAIIDKRERDGAFKSVSELTSVEGFDSEIIRRIRPYVTCR